MSGWNVDEKIGDELMRMCVIAFSIVDISDGCLDFERGLWSGWWGWVGVGSGC